jgi:hypothetical protein
MLREVIFEVAPFVVWIPLLVVLFSIKKPEPYIWLLIIHLLFTAVIQVIAYLLWKKSRNNLYLLHLYTVEELTMITLFYSHLLRKVLKSNFFLIIIITFIICAILNAIFLQPITMHNTYMRSLESLIIIIWTIVYFYHRLAEEEESTYQKEGISIINSGILLYFSTSLLLFTLSEFMGNKAIKDIGKTLWAIHALVSMLMYILIAIGLWKHQKTAT